MYMHAQKNRPQGHRVIFACDIVSFSDEARCDQVQLRLREDLYAIIARVFNASKIPLADCYHEDRGDGLFVILPPATDTAYLLSPLTELLDAEIRRQHAVASPTAQIQLRVSLHAGEVHADANGIAGRSMIHTFRLLDAPEFKRRVTTSEARMALIVSDRLYEDVIKQDTRGGSGPDDYKRIPVVLKETQSYGWMRLFGTAPSSDNQKVSSRQLLAAARALLAAELLQSAKGRSQLIERLPNSIAQTIERQPENVLDCYCIICACLQQADGIRRLRSALRTLDCTVAIPGLDRALSDESADRR